MLGGDSGLLPSFAQRKAIVKVCSAVLSHTMLGRRVDGILKLTGLRPDTPVKKRLAFPLQVSEAEQISHPHDFARVILILGDIVAGRLGEVQIISGLSCVWIAAVADYILGLRVEFRKDGITIWENFDPSKASPQITVEYHEGLATESIICKGQRLVLRDGVEFLRHFFRCPDQGDGGLGGLYPLRGGRCEWDSILNETFGISAKCLLAPCTLIPKTEAHSKTHPGPFDESSAGCKDLANLFIQFFVIGCTYYVYHTADLARYSTVSNFVSSAIRKLPELRPLHHDLRQAAYEADSELISDDDFGTRFCELRVELDNRGRCVFGSGIGIADGRSFKHDFCLAALSETVLKLSLILDRVTWKTPLSPKRSGLLELYNKQAKRCRRGNRRSNIEYLRHVLQFDYGGTGTRASIFESCMALFSGTLPHEFQYAPSGVSTVNDGRIHCFIDAVQNLSDDFTRATLIHIGVGWIEAKGRYRDYVLDVPRSRAQPYDYFSAQTPATRDHLPGIVTPLG